MSDIFISNDKPFKDMKTISGHIVELINFIEGIKKENDEVNIIDEKSLGDDEYIMIIEIINKDEDE